MHTAHLKPRLSRFLATEADTLALGAALARAIRPGLIVYLIGDLGAGKTTLARGILRGLGYTARVKRPTFTLVEIYKFSRLYLYHFDFYRFHNPEELIQTGFRDYFDGQAACLIEWPEKASGLPAADLRVELRVTDGGRTADLHAETEVGRLCLDPLRDTSSP